MRNFVLILNILIFEKTRYYNIVQSLYSHSISFDTRCERVRTLSGRRQRRTSIFWNIARSSQEAGSGSWCGVFGENSKSHGGEQRGGTGSVPVQCRKNNRGRGGQAHRNVLITALRSILLTAYSHLRFFYECESISTLTTVFY